MIIQGGVSMRIGNINGVGYNQNLIQATKQPSVDKEKLVNSTNEDNLFISDEGLKLLQKQKVDNSNIDSIQDNHKSAIAMLKERLEASKEGAKAFEDMAKLLEIARRISNGDQVPFKDEKKLLEFSPELYQVAKTAAVLHANKEPKEYKSMFEDEEENGIDNELQPLKESVSKIMDEIDIEE